MDNKKNEGLQSRREFFKSAAKAALPVIGAVALASLPILKVEAATGCYGSGCLYECDGSCNDSCYGSCKGSCNAQCTYGCRQISRYY